MTLTHVIGGRRVASASGRHGPVFDPATGAERATCPFADAAEVDAAVQDAARAYPAWAARSPQQRARVLLRFRELLLAHADELARLISGEHGKTLADAHGELQRGLEVVEFAIGIPHLLKGEHSAGVGPGIDMWSERQPLGVCAGITPFNFPAMVPMWMWPVAVACGNTFVLKPSEKDPSCPVRVAELFVEAGAPPGVLNVLLGDRTAVEALVAHPQVAAVSFVGSTPVAQALYAGAAAAGKRVQAMGGAKNHLVVMPDADLDQATDALIGAAYGSAGERCMAISVAVVVGDATADALVAKLAPRVQALRIGHPLEDGMDMGPLVTREHRDRVASYLALGVEEGAELVVDGRTHPAAAGPGFFLGGSLFDRVTTAMRIWRDEIFGPVLAVVRVATAEEALAVVHAHPFANGVAMFTRGGRAAREFAARVEVGMVGINVPIPVPLAFYSFGGWKSSAFGDLNQHGPDGVRFWTRLRTVTARWPEGAGGAEFSMPQVR
ncbi:MAG: CoA-acylating methylmalonate-semialdehyde dehydrogenase [Gemmatimonadales bacterium]|nr:CoA-acylating methylmalonate-semialdehyde dehydrogenase [Gemmatimonadales bacterium]